MSEREDLDKYFKEEIAAEKEFLKEEKMRIQVAEFRETLNVR